MRLSTGSPEREPARRQALSRSVHVAQDARGTLNSASLCSKVSWQSCKSTFAWAGAKPGTQSEGRTKMASNIRIAVDETARGLTIRWFETGLERHVWVDQGTFEQFLASGETIYLDTPAIATASQRLDLPTTRPL